MATTSSVPAQPPTMLKKVLFGTNKPSRKRNKRNSFAGTSEKKKKKDHVQALLDAVPRTLIRNNRNWLCVLCGAPGTGKSYTALRLAESIDPRSPLNG